MSLFADVNGVALSYDVHGEIDAPALLLIAGRGGQLTDWHDDLVGEFVAAGFRVVRFDNRDSGLSTHFEGTEPNLLEVFKGSQHAPYTLDDMADDAAGLLDHLGVARSTVLGLSLGGMIAQCLALRHPDRVSGLVLLSTTTGAPDVGQPSPEILQSMLSSAGQPAKTIEANELVEAAYRSSSRWTSWDLGITEEQLRERVQARVDRRFDPAGVNRQMAAVLSAPDRTESLRSLRAPTVVVHGTDDPLVNISGGQALAKAIPDAELVVIERLRHDLPRAIWPTLVDAVTKVSGLA